MHDIALMGRAGAGKDTVAEYLVRRYGYTRLALADPVRELALAIDPIVVAAEEGYDWGDVPERLSDLVSALGWDTAKRRFPEVRRTLQRVGMALRERDQDHWVRILLDEYHRLPAERPVVVTDVRFPNEVAALGDWFTPVWVDRSVVQLDDPTETSVGPGDAEYMLPNRGSIADLHRCIDSLFEK